MEGKRDELRSINKCGVWTNKEPPLEAKVKPLMWVYKVKKNLDGTIARYKCRPVAQGFYQVIWEDYFQTCSPVAKFAFIRTVLALSAQLGLKVRQMDVDTAFLNIPRTLAKGLAGAHFGEKNQIALKNKAVEW
jgi:Reverse transcriptase (RNA-dependent DNA polymerase)